MSRSLELAIAALVVACLAATFAEIVIANPEPVPPRGPVLYVTWDDRFDLGQGQVQERLLRRHLCPAPSP